MTLAEAARRFAEAETEFTHAAAAEIAKGTETDADLRRLLAETRIDPDIRARYRDAYEDFVAARAQYDADRLAVMRRLAENGAVAWES